MFHATITHHSISRARTVSAPTLAGIKRLATKEFNGEFNDYVIVIMSDNSDVPVSYRRVDSRHWRDQ